LLDLQSVRKL